MKRNLQLKIFTIFVQIFTSLGDWRLNIQKYKERQEFGILVYGVLVYMYKQTSQKNVQMHTGSCWIIDRLVLGAKLDKVDLRLCPLTKFCPLTGRSDPRIKALVRTPLLAVSSSLKWIDISGFYIAAKSDYWCKVCFLKYELTLTF